MRFVLTAKHWQVFLYLMLGMFINNFTVEGHEDITTILSIVGYVMVYSWPLVLGLELYNYLPEKIKLNYNLFVFNGFVALAAHVAVIIVSNGQGMTFDGLSALPGFYAFYAFLHLLAFPGRTLKSIEMDQKASFNDYIGNFFLVLFWPIGVWFVQPRVNKIAKHIAIKEANH
jgi:hypothetical protein